MKRITRLLAFMVALFSFSIAFAETGSETELTANIGGKDQPVVGQSYEVAGTYNAGAGSAQAGNMTSKGFKCRTGSDGNRVVFTVATNYTITKFVGEGISNYAMAEGVEGDVNVKVTKVEVDGVEVGFTGGEFPAKGADHSGNLTIDNIQATESIAIYFDNSNSAGKQLNLCYAIDWERPDASEPTITVTPSVVNLIPSASYKLSAKIDPASFTTVWKSANEAIATVAEDGTVTAVTPGVVEVSNQWTENADVKGAATITVNNIDLSKYAVVKAYDFTVMGDVELALQSEAAGNIWNEANKKANPVYFCTNEGLEQIAVQAAAASNGKGWSIVDGKGLFLGTGAGRCAAVAGITKGQIVEFIYTGDAFYTNPAGDDGIEKEALNEGKGRAIYRASEDGMIGFELIKGNAIEKINVYDVDLVTLPKLLTFPAYNDEEVSSYTKEWTATVNGAVWTLNGFNNNKNGWDYVRCGRKTTAQTATILSPVIKGEVTNVVFLVDKTSNVVKATLSVLKGEEVVAEKDITEQFVAGYVNVEIDPTADACYKLTVESDDQATANGPTQISKVGLYAAGQFVEPHIANTADDPYTVEKAIELIEAGEALNEIVFVKGIITQVDEVNAEYGNATYWIADSEGAEQQLQVYRGLNIGGEKFTSEDQLEVGATVVVKGQLLKYGSKYELNQGNELVSYSAPVDVTSEYLKNADFAASTPVEAEAIFGYGKDGSPYGLQDVEEWTKVVVREDPNSAADYPGSGMGGGVMAYGSPTILKGNNVAAPAVGPNGEAGNALGFFGVWACGGYYAQNVTLPAGAYTMSVPMYSQSGTAETTSYTGFFADGSDKGYTVATNPEPGAWATQTVKFVLTKETAGQIRLGYVSNGSGSGANPMLFIDGVKLVKADIEPIDIAKADLQAEIAVAEALLATGEKGKTELEEAIAAAKNVLATATTAEEMEAALNALKKAEMDFKIANAPVPSGTYYVMCASEEGDWFMAAGHNWGTRAIINNDGLDLTLNFDAPTGTYTIDTQVFNGNAKHFLGSDLYMDGAAFGWTIASDNGFTFTISNGTQYIGIDSEYNLALTDQPAEWAFLKADARIMALDEASAENPVDATFLVKGANFNRNDKRNDAWTRTSETADGGTNFNISGGNNVNNCAESYHAKFSLSQTVEGLPNGIYEMTAQGFYRQDGEDAENLPYFFINDEKVTFPLKTGEENSMANASESFTNGLYTIEPIKIVVEDGKITLGAKNDENLNLWCIWDNFRLTYYGEEVKPVFTSKPVPAFSEMADDGETIQYLYNVEAGGFLLGANDWNTRASVSESKGYQFKVAKAAEGTWTLNDYVENQNAWKAVFAENMSSIWVDNLAGANVNGWVIAEAGNGTYTITNPGADAEGKLAVHPLLNDSRLYLTNHLAGSTWAFVSEADYAKYLEDYAAWQEYRPEFLKSTEEGTDLTPAIGNICTSMDGWTITNESTFHINTWSWEGLSDGSWMTPSFLENWVAKGSLLPEGTVAKTISGLVPGQTYTVKAFMRAYNEGSQDVPQGAYLYAGDQQSADISTGTVTNYNGMAGVYGNFQVTAAADEEGNLTLGWVEKENNFNWIVMRDLQLFVGQVGDPNLLEQTITHERYPGLGYGATECTVDFTEAKAWLGVEQITTDMLRIENPDGELISDYAPFDGWFDGEGVATTWGENTKINVKFFQAIPDGVFTICDMNGADELGKTYTVKWRLVNGEKSVRYTINVKFVEKPVLDLTFADLNQKGNDVVVPFISELGKCYEGFSGDVDVAAILSTLEATSLSDVDIYAVQSDGSLDDNYKLGTTDGWRNAAGDWQGWGADARFYVKADFAREAGQLYEVGGMEGTTNEPASYTATYAFVKKGTKDAVVLKVTLTYPDPDELIANGNCEGADGGYLLSKNGDGDGSFIWNVQDGVGVDGSKAAVVHATGTAANEWDAQFFIFAKDHVFSVGEKYKVTMWLKADKAASNTAQAHTTPGNYKHWRIISDGSSIPFTTEWTEFVYEGVIDENMEGVQTIAFNLNTDKTLENNYYFDNISWKLIKEEDGIETVQTVQTEVNGIYNLRGQKVDKPVKGGIYIINGKKVVIK